MSDVHLSRDFQRVKATLKHFPETYLLFFQNGDLKLTLPVGGVLTFQRSDFENGACLE